MKKNPKHSNSIAYLRQLCCSGLSKEIVIPEFLRAIQSVLPSCNNVFSGCDEHFIPSYYLLGFVVAELEEHAPVVISRFLTPERRSLTTEWFRQHPVLTEATVWDESFYRSDLYNLVWRRNDQHRILQAPVMHDGKTVGMLCLYRPRQQKPFDNREQALCLQLLPYVSHALRTPDEKDIQYSDNGSSGMMILDTQGTILYLSPEAKKLLALACHPIISLDASKQEAEVLAKLAQLCRNLEAIFRGQHAAPPSWSHTSANGRFLFHAYWLDSQNKEPGGLVGMTIEHLEPVILRLLRAMQNLPLSPAQKGVALLVAQGFSSDKIGEHLYIKLNTVKDHISNIFTKLNINHREELLPLLLALDSSIAVPKVL
ncbi:MAG: helix-turn-helix transcriptional regulator [Methylococcales bacterium]|nr:helix-turn-helix transcriptional regulator [Methylococcales bacterium]